MTVTLEERDAGKNGNTGLFLPWMNEMQVRTVIWDFCLPWRNEMLVRMVI